MRGQLNQQKHKHIRIHIYFVIKIANHTYTLVCGCVSGKKAYVMWKEIMKEPLSAVMFP